MENQKASIKKIALNYGGIWGVLTIALSVIAYVTDNYLERPMWLTITGSAIMLGIIVYGLKAFKLENEGFLSVSESLKTGLAISLIAAIIGTIYNYVFMTFIEPDFVSQSIEIACTNCISHPDQYSPMWLLHLFPPATYLFSSYSDWTIRSTKLELGHIICW